MTPQWRNNLVYCPKCHQVYFANQIDGDICPSYFCTGHGLVGIDEMILPSIIELNKKGYTTAYCCSGHYRDDYCSTLSYVKFTDAKHTPMSYARRGVPALWYVDEDDETVMRSKEDDILARMFELHRWAESLMSIDDIIENYGEEAYHGGKGAYNGKR